MGNEISENVDLKVRLSIAKKDCDDALADKVKWIPAEDYEIKDEFFHHKCSACNALAIFDYIKGEDWDEGLDGEWYLIGDVTTGINEHITKYCPNCGAEMDRCDALRLIKGCSVCKLYKHDIVNYGYTHDCEDCGDYPWASDELPSKFKLMEDIE